MKVSFITTVEHNVGDDFVREGIKYLLKIFNPKINFNFQNIHKHSPISARYGFEKGKLLNYRLNKYDSSIPLWVTKDRIIESDYVIQSGAPVYWYHGKASNCVDHNEWFIPLIKRRLLSKKVYKFFNIAAGSCQTYNSIGTEFFDSEAGYIREYIKDLFNLSTITTVRDFLSKELLDKLECFSTLLPCTSIFCHHEYNITAGQPDYIVLNYMRGGAHYTLGQEVDFIKWEKEFVKLFKMLSKYENVVISCHNQKEIIEIEKILPEAKIFFSNDYVDYIKFYSKAKGGILNRVHGSFILSSFGKPSIVVGNDSRAKMTEQIGVPNLFVNEASADILLEKFNLLYYNRSKFAEKFAVLKHNAFNGYKNLLSNI